MISCGECTRSFAISKADRAFYARMDVPEPTLCPDCRMQRRMAFRNEHNLFRRTCDATGKQIISIYPQSVEFPVYHQDFWWSDKFDPFVYGQNIDFSRPFFEQIAELQKKVPRLALTVRNCENCEYVNNEEGDKNCYMVFAGAFCEDCYFCRFVLNSRDCMDCLNTSRSELCYECINVFDSYHCREAQDLKNCRDIFFSQDLVGCQDCIACIGLHKAQHHILNKSYSPQEYQQRKKRLLENYAEERGRYLKELENLKKAVPYRFAHIINSENCRGDYILNSKNCDYCFDVLESEDCSYVQDGQYVKDCHDCFISFRDQLVYNGLAVCLDAYHCVGGTYCWACTETMYSQHCFASSYLFGCIALNHKKYCILNKEYSKKEYEELLPKLIEHMKKNGEWGEFFSMTMSPFAYNETVAQEYFPLSKTEVAKRGWKWREPEEPDFSDITKKIPGEKLPDDIRAIPDDILNWAIICPQSKKLFRIQKGELAFYRKLGLPVPRFHPDVRHAARMKRRNPRQLWTRTCAECGTKVETSYAPERPEKIYCEKCYLKMIV